MPSAPQVQNRAIKPTEKSTPSHGSHSAFPTRNPATSIKLNPSLRKPRDIAGQAREGRGKPW